MTLLNITDRDLTDRELLEAAARLETAPASAVIAWAVENFHPHLCLTASMTDAVLIDLAVKVEPSMEVVFIDTGYHFAETLDMVELVRRRYGLNLRVMTALPQEAELWKVDPENCCSAIKTGQLDRALSGKVAWMSGVQRSDGPTRAATPVVHRDIRGLVKINPIATWTPWDIAGYIEDHDVPVHPLVSQGYLSIGCRPCTKPVEDGADPRSGRWAGLNKTECGMHV
ncbi:MAG: phosphoadenosine phosphosulfate reductase [Acidimicrobiaceae bacterium]|nr:phosphoadenosine phosphosulfate reductase [Acidimicrobiaceae bacterium]